MKVLCLYCTASFSSPIKEDIECPSCGSTDEEDFRFFPEDEIETDNPLIRAWVKIGRKNPWIASAWDPTFDEHSFYECETLSELIEKLDQGNWCVGQGFYYKNMAFINQVNGGDEWLVIRDDIDFESWSCRRVIRAYGPDYFATIFYRMYHATDEQLRKLNYRQVEVPETFEFDWQDYQRSERDVS